MYQIQFTGGTSGVKILPYHPTWYIVLLKWTLRLVRQLAWIRLRRMWKLEAVSSSPSKRVAADKLFVLVLLAALTLAAVSWSPEIMFSALVSVEQSGYLSWWQVIDLLSIIKTWSTFVNFWETVYHLISPYFYSSVLLQEVPCND